MSPVMQHSNMSLIGMSARNNSLGASYRRHSEINDSVMAGLKMRENQQVLKDQMQKN